jgi:hypothetical protein
MKTLIQQLNEDLVDMRKQNRFTPEFLAGYGSCIADVLVLQTKPTPQSDKPEPVEQEMPDVIKFLLGEGELNGKWFGSGIPEGKAPFWWRTELRKLYTLTKK